MWRTVQKFGAIPYFFRFQGAELSGKSVTEDLAAWKQSRGGVRLFRNDTICVDIHIYTAQ